MTILLGSYALPFSLIAVYNQRASFFFFLLFIYLWLFGPASCTSTNQSASFQVQGLKRELVNAQKSRKMASASLRMALQKAAQIRLMEKEKNKSPSYAMRISLKIDKVVWSMLVDGKSFCRSWTKWHGESLKMPFISNAWSYKDPQRGERNRVKQMKYNVNISIVANLTPQKKKQNKYPTAKDHQELKSYCQTRDKQATKNDNPWVCWRNQ